MQHQSSKGQEEERLTCFGCHFKTPVCCACGDNVCHRCDRKERGRALVTCAHPGCRDSYHLDCAQSFTVSCDGCSQRLRYSKASLPVYCLKPCFQDYLQPSANGDTYSCVSCLTAAAANGGPTTTTTLHPFTTQLKTVRAPSQSVVKTGRAQKRAVSPEFL